VKIVFSIRCSFTVIGMIRRAFLCLPIFFLFGIGVADGQMIPGVVASSIHGVPDTSILTLNYGGTYKSELSLKFNKATTLTLNGGTWVSTGTATRTYTANVLAKDSIIYTNTVSLQIPSLDVTEIDDNINNLDTSYLDVSRLVNLTKIQFTSSKTKILGSVAGLTSLTFLSVQGSNTLTGSVAGLTSLTALSVWGSNTLTGSVAGLTSLTNLSVQGSNTLTGSVAGLTSLTALSVWGNNTVTGSVAGLTSLTYMGVGGSNTLTGSVAGLTSLTNLLVTGNNTVTIDSVVQMKGLSYLQTNYPVNVNQILADFVVNKDQPKPRIDRSILLSGNAANYATGQGLTDAAFLRTYKSPNNTGPAVWTVTLAPTPVDTNATAFKTATGITGSDANNIDSLIKMLKDSSLWSYAQVIYPLTGGTSASMAYNLKDTSTFKIAWTGTGTYSTSGYTSGNVSNYGNTGWIPSVQVTSNHLSSMGVYSRTDFTGTYVDIGALSNNGVDNYFQIYSKMGTTSYMNMNTTGVGQSQTNSSSSRGWFFASRSEKITSNQDTYTQIDGTQIQSGTYTSGNDGIVTLPVYLGTQNNKGTSSFASPRQLSFVWLSNQPLTRAQGATLYRIVQKYMTLRGIQVTN